MEEKTKFFSKETLKKFFFSFIWLAVVVFVIDITTKWAVINHFGADAIRSNTASPIELIPQFLYITGQANNGAAFSLLNNARPFWIVVSVVLTGGLIAYYVLKHKKMNSITKACLMLMIAGAFGNLIDRAFYWENTVGFSGVVDWISVYLGNAIGFFPTFNIADSSLVIGVIILVVVLIIEVIKDVKERDKTGEFDLKPEEFEAKKAAEEASNNTEVSEQKEDEKVEENKEEKADKKEE